MSSLIKLFTSFLCKYLATCLANSVLPIPDEPRKRKTKGCSPSVQPFSLRLMAKK